MSNVKNMVEDDRGMPNTGSRLQVLPHCVQKPLARSNIAWIWIFVLLLVEIGLLYCSFRSDKVLEMPCWALSREELTLIYHIA